uniref:Serine/threonine-protein phosphatase 7 long form homolog n=1 Tax=Nicotiana tabacum TaxID=4097 RepID=A0A1S3YJP7_TOBAC|nr:PREDICTED: serine/threonine-protein phosphatase 7 long form homolog [Nicotiana tabacum]
MTGVQYLDMLHQLTSFWPQDKNILAGTSPFPLTTIREYLEILHPDIDGDTPNYHVHRYTRLLLLLMFGGVLFPNTSVNLVILIFFHHLERLDDLPQYSWGVAVLAYLYMQMCRESIGTQRDIAGLLSPLHVWARERFLQMQPPLPPLSPDVPPPFLPLARRWVLQRGYTREYEARHNLSLCRDILDLLEGAQTPKYKMKQPNWAIWQGLAQP